MFSDKTVFENRIPKLIISAFLVCIALWLCHLIPQLAGKHFLLPADGRLLIFPYPTTTFLWIITSLIVPLGTLLLIAKEARNPSTYNFNYTSRYLIFWPVVFLPISTLFIPLRINIDQQVVANTVFYAPIIVSAIILHHLFALPQKIGPKILITKRLIITIGIVFTVLYWLAGWYFTVASGAHSGDEGHYIVQARSLYEDHDLDLYNNFDEREQRLINSGKEIHLHISPTSKEGKYYSWHPFGLPLYLALLPPHNLAFRHLLLGLLSGLGSAGLLVICRSLNIGRGYATLGVVLFSLSAIWGIYSSRVLPELPGAVLAIWTGVALLIVKRHPWLSALLIVICCGYLPFLHQRFTPISLFGYILFALHIYRQTSRNNRWRPVIFATLGLVTLACVYLAINFSMFSTGISYTSNLFIAYPAGAWQVLTSNHSITYILPSFVWMFAAGLIFLFTQKNYRNYSFFTFLCFFGVLILSCTNRGWTGGASAMGRYLLVVCPLLLPPAIFLLERTNRLARWWFIFLSLISVSYLSLVLLRLPEFLSNFADPRYYIGIVYDHLHGLLDPFPEKETAITLQTLFSPKGYLFPILFSVCTFLLILHRRYRFWLSIYPILIGAAALYCHHPDVMTTMKDLDHKKTNLTIKHNAMDWVHYNLARSYMISHYPVESSPLFECANLFSLYQEETLPIVTTKELSGNRTDRHIFQPEMPPNDWSGRGFFWTTLGRPFSSQPNKSAFYLDGKLTGSTAVQLVVVELGGSIPHILFENTYIADDESKDIEIQNILHPTGDGVVHILARIVSGEGTLRFTDLGWSPFSDNLLEATRAYVPSEFTAQKNGT